MLGTGSHAVVYLARLNGQHVAVKVRWLLWRPPHAAERPKRKTGQAPSQLSSCVAAPCPPFATQVFELGAGLDSTAMWHEVALLRNCRHPRVVQLLGVAVEVRMRGAVCCKQVAAGSLLGSAMQERPRLLPTAAASSTLSPGRPAVAGHGAPWAGHPAGGAERPSHAGGAALGGAVRVVLEQGVSNTPSGGGRWRGKHRAGCAHEARAAPR